MDLKLQEAQAELEQLRLKPNQSTVTLPEPAELLNQLKGKTKTKATLKDVEAILEILGLD